MANRAFGPSSVTIAAGGSVTFVNDDDRGHTATGDHFDTGVLNSGAQSRQTFPSAGTFSFLCQIHPDMRGTVNVRGSSGAAPAPAATPKPTPIPTPVPPIVPEPGTKAASIVDFAFEPADISVPTGTTVTWQNRGQAPHTVTAGDGSFDSGMIAAGASYATTFDTPGTFKFACSFHPDMTGRIVVSAAAGASEAPDASDSADPSQAASASPVPRPLDLADGGPPAEPPAGAAGPDAPTPAASIREGAIRLLVVGLVTAGAVIAFGVLVAGTTSRSRSRHGR
jgi:plastocyanin